MENNSVRNHPLALVACALGAAALGISGLDALTPEIPSAPTAQQVGPIQNGTEGGQVDTIGQVDAPDWTVNPDDCWLDVDHAHQATALRCGNYEATIGFDDIADIPDVPMTNAEEWSVNATGRDGKFLVLGFNGVVDNGADFGAADCTARVDATEGVAHPDTIVECLIEDREDPATTTKRIYINNGAQGNNTAA